MNNTIVIRCDVKEFENNWIEFRTAWTRREALNLAGKIDQAFLDTIKPKVVALHIELTTGMVIDRADNLTLENLLDVDVFVWGWLTDAPLSVLGARSILGKASGRPSFVANGTMPVTMPTAQPQPTSNAVAA